MATDGGARRVQSLLSIDNVQATTNARDASRIQNGRVNAEERLGLKRYPNGSPPNKRVQPSARSEFLKLRPVFCAHRLTRDVRRLNELEATMAKITGIG